MGMKRGRKKYATTWQKKVYFIDRSPFSAKLASDSAKPFLIYLFYNNSRTSFHSFEDLALSSR